MTPEAPHNMRFSIKIISPNGAIAYLTHKDKSQWCKRTTQKHAREFMQKHGGKAELEQI